MALQRRRAGSTCSGHLAAPVGQTESQCAINRLLEEADFTRVKLRRRGFDFDVKFGDHGIECVVHNGHFSAGEHASLLLRHAIAHEACGHEGLANAVWRVLAENLGANAPGFGVLSDIEHLMEHDPEAFGVCHELRSALTGFDLEPGRTRIVTMAENLKRRMQDIPLERRTRKQALALVQAKLLLEGPFAFPTAERLTKLQTQIDIFPAEAQVARLELFARGCDFEVVHGDSGLTCVARGGRFIPTDHADLLTRYAVSVELAGHVGPAGAVWRYLAPEIGVPVSTGAVLSDIEQFIEHDPTAFASMHSIRSGLIAIVGKKFRTRIAAMADSLRRRMNAIPVGHRTSNQTRALLQAKLLLGSFTDTFQELFENDPAGACEVARTLMVRKHEGSHIACRLAIFYAVKMRLTQGLSKDARQSLEVATRPIVSALSGAISKLVERILMRGGSDFLTDDEESEIHLIRLALAYPDSGKGILANFNSRLDEGFKQM